MPPPPRSSPTCSTHSHSSHRPFQGLFSLLLSASPYTQPSPLATPARVIHACDNKDPTNHAWTTWTLELYVTRDLQPRHHRGQQHLNPG